MRFVAVFLVFFCNVLVANDILLDKVEVSFKDKKELLDYPTRLEISDKDKLLQHSDMAKSFSKLSGFSMMRKGGFGSEIFYRSQGGARMPILLDGSSLHGGCSGRMDNAISYIDTQSYHSVSIIKGPQDLRYATVMSGAVLFEREILRLTKPTYLFNYSTLYGSYARFDNNINATIGDERYAVQIFASDYKSNDYKDANNNKINSKFHKQNLSLISSAILNDTAVELSFDASKANAAYADRQMDGVRFDRRSLNFKLEHDLNTKNRLNLSSFYHEIDHKMDNFTMRNPSMSYQISNPKRKIKGLRLENITTLDNLKLYAGLQREQNSYKNKSASGNSIQNVNAKLNNQEYQDGLSFDTKAIFLQGQYMFDESALFAGYKNEHVRVSDAWDNEWQEYGILQKPSQRYDLNSAFMRFERYYENLSAYIGVAHAQRSPDFWEFNQVFGYANNNTYDNFHLLKKEKNNQLDTGVVYKNKTDEISLGLFYSKVNDYILLSKQQAFNTNALIYGAEADLSLKFYDILRLEIATSYIKGVNKRQIINKKAMTNAVLNRNDALPQIAPLSFKLGLGLEQKNWFAKLDMQANSRQNRIASGFGSVSGLDSKSSSGFAVYGFSAGVMHKNMQVIFGVDNLTNKSYSYHLSKISANDVANKNDTKINEIGRNFYIKFKLHI
ncbi:TonB-dependent receptor domain-containing protein [Campylobacter majalis]|uniref:TonB-dependent receptor domain-containing protein n=1 Tax=Campylobacter majalis TaxID=2790656 RepID=UPI003D6984F2